MSMMTFSPGGTCAAGKRATLWCAIIGRFMKKIIHRESKMNRIWFSFARRERLRYISHLDMLRLFIRALRRGRLPLVYSKGFNPHPRFSLALPLPLGTTADDELGEVFLTAAVGTETFVRL
ncbi:MAG TPA: DUF2344 domain-containing protein, partial [Firmicutes bacterium]|nr:DUF2344 domain-containing protein [Bacillota bacterium]